MWETLKTRAGTVLIPLVAVALGILAAMLWLRFADRPDPVYLPGPTSVQTVYEPKWKDRIKPVPYPVPAGTRIEFFPKDELAKGSKIPDAPDNAIAFGQVPPHSGRTTVFATLKPGADNVMRGGLEYRQEKTPFFQIKREMGLRGGYGTEGILGEAYLRPARVGPVDLEARVYGRSGSGNGGSAQIGAAILFDMKF